MCEILIKVPVLKNDLLRCIFIKQESSKFKAYLEETENWLYDEGEDQQKSVYVQRLNELKVCKF